MSAIVALRVALVLLATLAAVRVARRGSSARRADLLGLGTLAALALPLAARLPGIPLPSAPPAAEAGPGTALAGAWVALQEPAFATTAATAPGIDLAWLVGAGWIAGAVILGLRLLAAHTRAALLRRGTRPISGAWADAVARISPGAPVRSSADIRSPILVGLFRPVILVPEEVPWDAARRERVIHHEAAHAARRDNLRLLLAQVVCAVHWFDPLAWILTRRLRLEIERAADEAVVHAGIDPATYAGDLVDLARAMRRTRAVAPALASLGGHPLDRRVRALLEPVSRRPLPRAAVLLLGGGLVLTALGLGTPVVAGSPPPAGGSVAQGSEVQAVVESAVAGIVEEWQPEAVAVVVVDARTGEVLATGEHGAGAADRAWASGSVVKPFVAVAALDAGIDVDPDHLAHLLEVSSNEGFLELAGEIGTQPLSDSLRAQGLSAAAGDAPIDLAFGQFPTTARELAVAYAHLGDTRSGRDVRGMLTQAVHGDEATGRAAALPGLEIAGKTGTALMGSDADPDTPVLASFVGLVPADDPRWSIAVQVAAPQPRSWGGKVAAPAFARIVQGLQ